jgi:uncharacterized repeat protein (TIGR01451 family)
MKRIEWRTACMVGLLIGTGGLSQAAEPVTSTLVVHRITVTTAGLEVLAPASSASPGDLLEYVAEFHNTGPSTARGLSATLPLPKGTEFVLGSTHPAAQQASVDGTTFAPLPLKRIVKDHDGSSHEELVPAGEYRFLRWSPTDLAASGEFAVSARVRIAATPKAP